MVKENQFFIDEEKKIARTHVTRSQSTTGFMLDELAVVVLQVCGLYDFTADNKDDNMVTVTKFSNHNGQQCAIAKSIKGYVGFGYERALLASLQNGGGEVLIWNGFAYSADNRAELLDIMI